MGISWNHYLEKQGIPSDSVGPPQYAFRPSLSPKGDRKVGGVINSFNMSVCIGP